MNDELTILLCTLAGSLVGAWIGAYIQGRATEKGRIAAIRSALGDVLQQAQERSRAEERGKRMATHDDIENVLREVRLVTAETESIKARVGVEAQERLSLRQEKRTAYGEVIRILSDMSRCSSEGQVYLEKNKHVELTEVVLRFKDLYAALLGVSPLVDIFGSEKVRVTVSEFFSKLKIPSSPSQEWLQEIKIVAATCRAKLVLAAREDFGVASPKE